MAGSGNRSVIERSAGSEPSELPKQYRPADHEVRIRESWEQSGAFHADPSKVLPDSSNAYCIIIPPPNVTDRLHLGHALNNTLQDILVRAHRMMGFETLWMPGTDHAGIATQAVVERRLRAEGRLKGPLREAFSREDFVAIVQSFKDEYEATITGQLRAMGCSCDWARQRFTMDQQCARAVQEAFFRLFKDGLIYRGKRLVNWDPVLQTAVADDECEDIEVDGTFYYLRYPLVRARTPDVDPMPVTWSELRARGWPAAEDAEHEGDKQAWVTVATTRPETYLGDTAVAVNPRDPRAGALRGLSVKLPLVGRVIPVIEDDYVVMPAGEEEREGADPKAKFATGFLKVTPAHDPNDYEIGQRHHLPMVNIFAPDATISGIYGWTDVGDAGLFVGKSREEARTLVVDEFQARGLLAARRPYRHSVKHSDRSKAAIEPYLSDQWYVRVTDDRMAGAALRAMSQHASSASSSSSSSSAAAAAAAAATNARGTGVPPVSTPPPRASASVSAALSITTRNLPHWQKGGKSYFVTFRLARGTLSPPEQKLVMDACRHWDGQRLELHAATVMPDHVHLVLSPFAKEGGGWWSLSELLHSIKSFSSHEIAKRRGQPGPLWQDESYDRIIREDEYADTMAYVLMNAVHAGLAPHWQDYEFTWTTDQARSGQLRFPERVRGVTAGGGREEHRRDACATSSGEEHRRDAGATSSGEEHRRDACATSSGEEHRRDAGATSSGTNTGGTPVPRAVGREHTGDGSLMFYPERYSKTFEHWHENIRDWCISRQLWWGHRVPVWSGLDLESFEGSIPPPDCLNPIDWKNQDRLCEIEADVDERGQHPAVGRPGRRHYYCVRDAGDVEVISFLENRGCVRDPDVLDTWFSSALWPMSTMGWPEKTELLRAYNPSDVLCTSREIITLWVSRMVMFNRYFMREGGGMGPPPFRDVFIHAMIQDGEGRKMSKSLGNGVDPLDIIASHGADAMRFTLCQLTTHTQDVRMPVERDPVTGRNTSPKFDLGRNFCNKLWNAARFALGILGSGAAGSPTAGQEGGREAAPERPPLADRWMLSRLAWGVMEIEGAIRGYSFGVYAQAAYDLLWRDFCDWYLEAIKPTVAQSAPQRAVLAHALETIVRLLHPITPFITEAIWERLREVETDAVPGITLGPSRVNGLLCTAGWPRVDASLRDEAVEREFERVRGLITAVREVRAEHQVPPKRRVTLHAPAELVRACRAAGPFVLTMAGLESLTSDPPTGAAAAFTFESSRCQLSNLADAAVDAGAERLRLDKRIADLEKSEKTLEARLSNPGYTEKAPPAMVDQTREQLAKVKSDLSSARSERAGLG
jgi:valyl-tRNA synthetase